MAVPGGDVSDREGRDNEYCTCTYDRGERVQRDPMCPDHGDDEPEELNP